MATIITRNRTTGVLSINNSPAALRGGAYDLFYNPKQSIEVLAYLDTQTPIRPRYEVGRNPCQTESVTDPTPEVEFVSWDEGNNSFEDFFLAMTTMRCNFVRVFLAGGAIRQGNTLATMTPFNHRLVNNRFMYDVRGAVLGNWNADYFNRLSAFVAAADTAGVVVQLSLFNYFDINDDDGNPASPALQWTASPWNAANCIDAAWGEQHLVPSSLTSPQPIDPRTSKAPQRHRYFVRPQNELRAVQQEFIGRVIKSIGTHKNVVLELMNEPHGTTTLTELGNVAEFDSYMTKLIINYRRSLSVQALISVNATPHAGKTDLELWKNSTTLANFAEPDIVSYHGLTMLPNNEDYSACGSAAKVSVERVDSGAIALRAAEHARVSPDKALLYSTDAVLGRPFIHVYNNRAINMRLRDGQIICGPENDGLEAQLLRTNVYHWAKKCLAQNAGAAKGRYHFHNHSPFRLGVRAVGNAATELGL